MSTLRAWAQTCGYKCLDIFIIIVFSYCSPVSHVRGLFLVISPLRRLFLSFA